MQFTARIQIIGGELVSGGTCTVDGCSDGAAVKQSVDGCCHRINFRECQIKYGNTIGGSASVAKYARSIGLSDTSIAASGHVVDGAKFGAVDFHAGTAHVHDIAGFYCARGDFECVGDGFAFLPTANGACSVVAYDHGIRRSAEVDGFGGNKLYKFFARVCASGIDEHFRDQHGLR